MRETLRDLYAGEGPAARRGRLLLLGFDIAIVGFFVVTTFLPMSPWLVAADYAIGLVLLADYAGRAWAAPDRADYLLRPLSVLDLVVIFSLFAPAVTENFAFLRVLRTLRLLRTCRVLRDLRRSSRFFARHEDLIFSALNLLIFIFVISSVVYVLQARSNDRIENYIDALYFTVTTLTTTGFGDITLQGESGRLLSVVIMIVGVSLFLRLVQTIFRPARVTYECPDCGLRRHDPDAVHCKHCGRLLHIPTEGAG